MGCCEYVIRIMVMVCSNMCVFLSTKSIIDGVCTVFTGQTLLNLLDRVTCIYSGELDHHLIMTCRPMDTKPSYKQTSIIIKIIPQNNVHSKFVIYSIWRNFDMVWLCFVLLRVDKSNYSIKNCWRYYLITHILRGRTTVLLSQYHWHYSDVIMGALASRITSVSIYSTVCSGLDQRKRQSSVSLAFVRETRRWPVYSPHKGSVTRKMFPFEDAIMEINQTDLGKIDRCLTTNKLKELTKFTASIIE